jgi:hypothetical protein
MAHQILDSDIPFAVQKAWQETKADSAFKENLHSRLFMPRTQSRERATKTSGSLPNLLFACAGVAACAAIIYGLWLPTKLNL